MSNRSFYHYVQLAEAGLPPTPPAAGAPPTEDPMAAGGMPPMGGDPMAGGMPPMGGGMGAAPDQKPIPIKTIPAADIWKVLRKIVEDPKLESFFDEINVGKNPKQKKVENKPKPKSLLR